MSGKKTVDIIKVNNGTEQAETDEIVVEQVLKIYINNKLYSSLMCTPIEKLELAVGFLFTEGVISSMESIKSIEETDENTIYIILDYDYNEKSERHKALTSGCAKGSIDISILKEIGIKPVEGCYEYSYDYILQMMKEFNHKSELFKATGGVHSCAVCSSEGIILFAEDIGRHNALDKVIGKALHSNIMLKNKLLLTTGRISSEIVLKALRAEIPIIVSHSASTDMAIEIAKKSNITIAGFARGNRMNIY